MHCSKKLVPLKHRSKIHAEKAEPGVNWGQERRRRRVMMREAGGHGWTPPSHMRES